MKPKSFVVVVNAGTEVLPSSSPGMLACPLNFEPAGSEKSVAPKSLWSLSEPFRIHS